MRYVALITGEVLDNVIVLGDGDNIAALPSLFGCDDAVDVTDEAVRPGPGWSRVDGAWVAPPEPEPEPEPAPPGE